MKTLRLLLWPFTAIWARIGSLIKPWMLSLSGEAGRHRRKAQRLANTMLHEFSRLGFTKKITSAKGKTRRQRVRFEYPLLLTHDELWCPIALGKLPTGVRTDDLRDEAVLRSIEDRLDAGVRIDYLANGKLCFVVRMAGSAFPEKYSFNAVQIAPEAPPLTVPFGVDSQGEQVLLNLVDVKHLLIAGATGGGKTTLQHAIISTLITRNTADDLELWLIDMKRTEFNLYRPLLGRRNEGGIVRHIAVEPEEAVQLLDSAFREINRRNQLMEAHKVTSLSDLVQSTGVRLKRLVLMVDEFAMLTLSPEKIGKQSVGTVTAGLMARIAALGRSAGVTIIIATQMIQREVLSGIIRANFENRCCFSTADWRQSQMVVESSEADGLPSGRAVLRIEGKTREVQTCFITSRQVRIEVDRIAEFGPDGAWGVDLERARFVREAKLLVSAACQHFAGDMARSKVLQLDGVRGVISQDRFNEVAQRLERDGVLEPGRSNRPRHVAKAFFGRASLLDSLYGMPFADGEPDATAAVTAPEPGQVSLDDDQAAVAQQDAPAPHTGDDAAVVCGLPESPAHDPDPDAEEAKAIAKYEQVKKMIEAAAEETQKLIESTAEDAPKRRKRKG